MLGPEKEIISNYVDNGQVKIIFWPIVDFGPGSMNAQAAADCVGRQSADAFWNVHDRFFENQRELSSADDAYFAAIAESVGVDVAQFAACYSSGEAHGHITALDSQRREAGIRQRPTFDINGQQLFGAQPFAVFAEVIEAKLAGQ